jgi:NAD-dependent SIR2 family protein deacetylase
MGYLSRQATQAKPTKFHLLIRRLWAKGSLIRIYTQNIDGLEAKVGLQTSYQIDPRNPPICVALHGLITHLCCSGCANIFTTQAYHSHLDKGSFPECPVCRENSLKRIQDNKRATPIPRLQTKVILYGDTHPQGEEIADLYKRDIGVKCNPKQDLKVLLVVGTSLKISSVVSMIKEFSKNPGWDLIYINQSPPISATANVFGGVVQGDCQEFADAVLRRMGLNSAIDEDEVNEERLDSRESWMWWS